MTDQAKDVQLTTEQQLSECESRIARGWTEMATALLRIRDEKLYREGYKTFQEYCEVRWGYKKSHAHRLMSAAETLQRLERSPIGVIAPQNEAQIRPLTKLPPESQANAWEKAVSTAPIAPDGSPRVTAKHVEGVVQRLTPEEAKRPGPPPPTQDVLDLRDIKKAFELIAEIPYPGDTAYEKYGFPAFGPKADTACDWMMDFIGAHRGNSEIAIRLQDGSYWHPTNADVTLWRQTYPKVDIEAELRKCAAWNDANPSKRKTHKGVKRHVNTWLSSASDRLQKNGSAPSSEFEKRHVEL